MFGKSLLLFVVTALTMLLVILSCRAAAPTATPVPPAPTKAPAPTVAPAPAATLAPAPVATTAPAPTPVPVAPTPSVPEAKLAKAVVDLLKKYPNMVLWTEANLPKTVQPKLGGTYRRTAPSVGGNPLVPHWDPRLLASVANGVGFCYGGLLRFAIDRINVESRITPVPLPDAAESWKQLDDLTWEFKLNPNVYWHDRPPVNGRKVTAEDIKYGIEQLRDNSIHRGVFKIISEITIKDPSTITIKTSEPYAHMLKILAGALYVFTAPEMVKEPGGAKTWCVGYGPWKLVKWDPQGGYEMERHPRYHLKGHTGLQLPYMDRIEHFTFSDGATQIAAFVTRKVHNIVAFGADQTIAILDRCTPNGTCQGDIGTQTPAASARILMRLDKAPFNDVRVRRALSMGMDRQAILDTIYQGVGYPSQQVPFDAMGLKLPLLLDQRGPYHQFNPTEAKRLLAEAGYPDGFETTMVIGTSPGPGITIPETIQFQWKENLKVRVQFEPKESLAFSKTLFDKTYGAMIYAGSTINALDWDSHTYGMMHSKSGSNWAYVNDPEVDRLVEAQRTTFDPVKQRDIYWKIFDLDEKNIYRIDSVARYNLHLYDISLVNATGSNYTWFSDYAQRSLEAVWFKD